MIVWSVFVAATLLHRFPCPVFRGCEPFCFCRILSGMSVFDAIFVGLRRSLRLQASARLGVARSQMVSVGYFFFSALTDTAPRAFSGFFNLNSGDHSEPPEFVSNKFRQTSHVKPRLISIKTRLTHIQVKLNGVAITPLRRATLRFRSLPT